MAKPRLLGLTGFAQSGKDSVAGFLKDYGYQRVAFADGVREMALVIDPIIYCAPTSGPDYVRLSGLVASAGWDAAKQEPEVRRLLQRIGTEAVRDMVDQDAWVRIGMRKAKSIILGTLSDAHFGSVVITDVRFPNEARAVHSAGGEVWRIERPGFDSGVSREHASEAHVASLPVDRVLVATNLEGLQQEVALTMLECS